MEEHKPILKYDVSSAMSVSKNPYQGLYKRILCVCSAGILRSATTALVLSKEPFNFNTRSAGLEKYALIPVTEVLLEWADEIVCMTQSHKIQLQNITKKSIKVLNILDSFVYRDKELQDMIVSNYIKE